MYTRIAHRCLQLRPRQARGTLGINDLGSLDTLRSQRRLVHIPAFRGQYPSTRHPIRSSVSGPVAIVVAVAAATCYAFILNITLDSSVSASENQLLELIEEEEKRAIMTGAPLPGRPGNLTAEQEVKLQEFWTTILHVFGLPEPSNGAASTPEGASVLKQVDQPSRRDSLGSDKQKKKKRLSLFSRKHDDADDGASGAATEGEDKYGQTKDFHKVLENQTPEELRTAFWSMVKHDNPDALLLRFLRARKWNVHNALVMLVATMHWRQQEMHVDDNVVLRGEGGALLDSASSNAHTKKEGEDFLMQMRKGKSYLHGSDKEGRPVCTVRVRLHRQADQSEASLERFTVYTIETARLMLSSQVDTAAILFDMTDFSMANMDYAPVKFMIKVFEANYPESLGVVLVHKAPWIFQSIWKIIKGWLDPVVAAKVHFTRHLEDLEQFVAKDHIPKELGGDDPWTYSFTEPHPEVEDRLMSDEATKKKLLEERQGTVKEYEKLTQQWIHNSQEESLAKKRDELADSLRRGYWDLDPYLRARTLYDRTGIIGKGGQVTFYPGANGTAATSTTTTAASTTSTSQNGPLPAQHGADDVD